LAISLTYEFLFGEGISLTPYGVRKKTMAQLLLFSGQNHGVQPNAIPHGDQYFPPGELQRVGSMGKKRRASHASQPNKKVKAVFEISYAYDFSGR